MKQQIQKHTDFLAPRSCITAMQRHDALRRLQNEMRNLIPHIQTLPGEIVSDFNWLKKKTAEITQQHQFDF